MSTSLDNKAALVFLRISIPHELALLQVSFLRNAQDEPQRPIKIVDVIAPGTT